jgi:hypothetical protein
MRMRWLWLVAAAGLVCVSSQVRVSTSGGAFHQNSEFGSSTAESVTARLLLQLHAPTALCPVPACQGMPCGGLVWHSGHNLLFLALNSVQQPSVLWRV